MKKKPEQVPYIGFEIEKDKVMTEVRASGRHKNYQPNTGMHRHHHHEILVIKKGGGTQYIDFHRYEIQDNQVFFLRPGQLHQFIPSKNAEFYFVAIDSDEIQVTSPVKLNQFEFFQSFYCDGHIIFDEVDSLIRSIQLLQTALANKHKVNQDILIGSATVIFLVQLQQKFLAYIQDKGTKEGMTSSVVKEFNHYLDNPHFHKRFVKDYANVLYVSANYLNEMVKAETEFPASYWINQKIITEAKRLLRNTRSSSKEIATTLSFSNPGHFNRFFKRHTRITPLAFRAEYQS